ncbi:MAG: histidine kinase [Rhodobacteraceae bacterium PARR1]|nr:MAG: histidine kinase [Rhodobacteraceae bacterium PARR1]
MIDWVRVENLRQEIGAADFAEVVALFLEETDEVAARMTAGPGLRGDLRADLHFLKGSALNLGFRALALRCGQGEDALRDAEGSVDPAPIVALYHATRTAFLQEMEQDQIRNSANSSSLVMSR